MYDHITPRNAKLIRALKEDPRILSAWFYNGKIFALDNDNIRHKYYVSDKVKHTMDYLDRDRYVIGIGIIENTINFRFWNERVYLSNNLLVSGYLLKAILIFRSFIVTARV